MELIKVLKIAPMEKPELIEIEHTLENLQKIVGGYIEALYPWSDPVALVCSEEGKLKGYTPNRLLVDENGEPYDIIVGTFLISGLTTEDFGSLSDELAEKYTERFRYPEMFVKVKGGGVLWSRLGSGEKPQMIV